MFLDLIKQAVIEECRLTKDAPILVGVSGGADSLALMLGLQTLGYQIVVAHLDHALRPTSAEDAEFVQHFAKTRAVPFVLRRVDAERFANSEGLSLEEAAREIRYQFLFEQARKQGAQAVAVAHHADDQVETVLMHFLRGAALSGLSGMRYRREMPLWDADIPLVRPLLGVWREEIEVYVAGAGLTPRVDASNEDTTYFRNRLRHELIPALRTYNPQIREAVLRMADVLREEDRFLDSLSHEVWDECFKTQYVGVIVLSREIFILLPTALQRRVLRYAISLLRPDLRDVDFRSVERAVSYASQPAVNGEIDLVGRLKLVALQDDLVLKTWTAELPDGGKPLLPRATTKEWLEVNGVVDLRHGWQITAKLIDPMIDNPMTLAKTISASEAYFDLHELMLSLQVRGREAGDRWQPLGMGGHSQKLSDFFINEKIPEHLRDIWPLVCSGDQIIWVVGLRPSEAFKVTQETQEVLHLEVVKSAFEKVQL